MTRSPATLRQCLFVGALATLCASVAACGGEIVGIGNSGNRIAAIGMAEEVAEALAEVPETPQVTDDVLAQIFPAILRRAKQGDPEAALIVMHLAKQQREQEEE